MSQWYRGTKSLGPPTFIVQDVGATRMLRSGRLESSRTRFRRSCTPSNGMTRSTASWPRMTSVWGRGERRTSSPNRRCTPCWGHRDCFPAPGRQLSLKVEKAERRLSTVPATGLWITACAADWREPLFGRLGHVAHLMSTNVPCLLGPDEVRGFYQRARLVCWGLMSSGMLRHPLFLRWT